MKIAVSATADNLDAMIDPRFGRCQYFIIADSETDKYEVIENSNAKASGGAGIQSAQLISNKGVKIVLTGNCGPNAFQTLKTAGIDVIVEVSGTIKNAIEKYKTGELKSTQGPSVEGHFGMKK